MNTTIEKTKTKKKTKKPTGYKFTALQEAWLQALESGKYTKAKDTLCRINSSSHKSYCCLGVACEVYNNLSEKLRLPAIETVRDCDTVMYDGDDTFLPSKAVRALKIRSECGNITESVEIGGNWYDSLAEMNDGGVRHKTIAKFIRNNPKSVFN